jgi:hypothetical protein
MRERATLTQMDDLRPDPRNANTGTERGAQAVESSLSSYGAARSIVVDKHGVVIAGNKTLEACASIGLTRIVVVPTDGTKLVVVQRTDLDLATDAMAMELAIADNRTAEVGLAWDVDTLRALQADGADLSKFWTTGELDALYGRALEADDDARDVAHTFDVVVECKDAADQRAFMRRMRDEARECRAVADAQR